MRKYEIKECNREKPNDIEDSNIGSRKETQSTNRDSETESASDEDMTFQDVLLAGKSSASNKSQVDKVKQNLSKSVVPPPNQ